MFIDTFMENYFNNLPNDLQIKIMMESEGFKRPKPKFVKGNIVRYKNEIKEKIRSERKELQRRYSYENLGNSPIHCLHISTQGRWCISHGTYEYEYEYGYGLTSEGYALECDLEKVDHSGFHIF